MKLLQVFQPKKVTENDKRTQELGRLLVQQPKQAVVNVTPQIENEIELLSQVDEAKDKEVHPAESKLTAHREFAEEQLAKSSPAVHHKLRHYD